MENNYTKDDQRYFIAYCQMDKNELRKPSTPEEFDQYAKSIFDTAESYYNLSSLGMIYDFSHVVAAIIPNISFACELYMKAILVKEKLQIIRGHYLKELFDLISDEAKTRIKESVGTPRFDMFLNEINKAFEISRYTYEYNGMATNLYFIIQLMEALRTECIQHYKLQCTENMLDTNNSGEQTNA